MNKVDLIERYVSAVKKYLPNDLKDDIGKELKTNIIDMLPDNYSQEEVYGVLTELGNPKKLANEYNPKKKYLIGPAYYDKYISLLKIVIGIAAIVSFSVGLLDWIFASPSDWYQIENFTTLFATLISSTIDGAIQGALWVTIIFVIIERNESMANNISFNKKEWTPDDLPELSEEKLKISRGESLFSMVVTILFTTLFYFNPQLIAIYNLSDNDVMNIIPLFSMGRLSIYVPIIIIFALVQLVIFIFKYITESWNQPLAIVNALYNGAVCLLVLIMISDGSLINNEFIMSIVTYGESNIETVLKWFNMSKWVTGVFIVGISLYDSLSIFYKLSKISK